MKIGEFWWAGHLCAKHFYSQAVVRNSVERGKAFATSSASGAVLAS